METKHLFSKGVLWRKCLAYVKHMLSMSWTGGQQVAIVPVSARSNGAEEKATRVFRKSRVSPVMLRGLAALLMLFIIGVGNAWGAEGDVLKTYDTNSSTFKTGYKRQSGDNFVWWGQKNYLGANNATNHGNLKPTAADLPVVKAQNASAATSTTGLYYCYTSEAVANVGALEIYLSAKSGSSTVNAYIVTSSTAASSGSATWTKVTLSASSANTQGKNVASANTYRFTFNATETGAKYYGVVFATSSYWRATGFQMKLIEGATASCSASPTVGTVSANGPFNWSAHTFPLSVSSIGAGGDGCAISEYGFVWNANTDPTISNNKTKIGESSSATSFTGNITNASFATGTTYKVKAYVTNDGGNTTLSNSYTLIPRSVTFNMNGHGTAPATQYVANGEKATQPSDPTADGWTFGGWYKEAGCTNVWNFSTETVTGANKTIYAKWTEAASLSSISVSTAPTTTKYLVGDNFDPTGLVITRTYSNSTSDTYTYAGHTSEFSFSPSTSLTAGTNKDITITYGGKTTTTKVDVYTVTVNKVNMSGTAITNAGVTASCSGRTLSQSVGSTNYKFNSWNVTAGGVSVSSNSITGTPTGNVTINAKFHDPITVAWKVGTGNASGGTTEVKYNTKITTLPTTPADNALGSCADKFMGWSTSDLGSTTGQSAPSDLFTSASDAGVVALTSDEIYYAVFASEKTAGVDPVSITAFATGDYYLIDKQGDYYYAMSGTGTSKVTGVDITSNVTYNSTTKRITIDDVSSMTAAMVYTISGTTSAAKVYNASTTAWVSTQSSGTSFNTSEGANMVTKHSSEPRFAFSYADFSQSNSRCFLYRSSQSGFLNYSTSNMGASGYGEGWLWVVPAGAAAEYENYVTKCCTQLDAINGSVSSYTQTSVTLQWDKLSHVDGTTPYTVTCLPAGTVGSIDLSGAKATCTVTGLSCNTAYTFSITAHGTTGYCDKTQSGIAQTTSSYTVSYTVNNGSKTSGDATTCGPLEAVFSANPGYSLPEKAGVTVTGASDFSWTKSTGTLNITAGQITGNISITVNCVANSCSDKFSFHYGTKNDNSSWLTSCFEKVKPADNTDHEWQITGFTVPSTTHFYVGYAGEYKDGSEGHELGSSSRSATRRWHDNGDGEEDGEMYLALTQNDANKMVGQATGAIGTLRIYDNSNWNNCYVGFIPNGYGLCWGTGSWNPNDYKAFVATANANEYETDFVDLTATQISSWSYYVGLQSSDSYVFCDASEVKTLSSMGTYSRPSSSWGSTVSTLSAGQHGKFRIWVNNHEKGLTTSETKKTDQNFVCHFVPYYRISYNGNGGTGSTASSSYVETGGSVNAASNGFNAPTGKQFAGWANSSAHATAGTVDYAAGASVTLTGDLTLYAVWSDRNYTVTMQQSPAAGASLTGGTTTAHYTGTINISTTVPDGYRFNGWTASPSVTFASASSTSTSFTMPANDVTITANFVQTHTVTWLSNGSNYVSPVTYDHGASLTLPAGTPSAPGGCSSKTFVGWTSNATEISVEQHNAPTMLDPENLGTVTTNATYRAVFADGTSTTTYKWVRKEVNSSFSLSDVSEGQWALVTSDGHAFNGTMSSGHGQPTSGTVTFTNNEAASMPSGYCELTFTKVMDGNNIAGYTMYNSTYGYLYASKASSGGLDWHNSESSYWYYYGDNWRYNSNSATLRVYNNSFRTYNSSSNSTVWLAKKTSVTTSTWDNYVTICSSCTTPSDLAMSNITSTGGKVSWTGVSLSPTEGYKVAWNTSNSVPGTLDGTNSANVDADKSEYTISGLTPATRYYVFVQSKCNSTWSSSTNFYTNAKITYAPGTGGTGTMDPQEVTYNTNATAAANSFDPNTGKEFTGWLSNVAVTVNGGATPTTSVPAGATINSLTQAITLTAQWADIPQYTITFNVPSGFTAVSDIVKYRDETFNFPNVTMKAGLDCASFAGWVLGASYTTQTTFYQYNETSSPVTANATYTAVFYQEDGQSDATADQYELVTNVADLKAGEKYLIVGYKSSTTTYYALGMQNGNNRSGVAITVTDNKTQPTIATSTSSTDVYELTLGGSAGAWTFKDVSNTYLEANSGTQNYLRLSSTDDDKIKWVITIANDGLATIDTKYYSTEAGWHGTIFFNTTSNLFSCYEQNYASFPKVYLFKKGGANQYTTTANPSCAAKHNLSWTVDVAAGGAVKVNNQTSGPIEVREGNTVEAVVTSTTAGYQFNGWTWTTNTGGAVIASPSATTTDITMGTADAALKANFAVIQVTSLKFKALQTGESDKLGNNLTMSMYPGEGQASDPLEHTATVTLHEKLPATALAVLTSDFTWSVRVKASGAADWTNVSFSGNELGTNAVLQKYNKSNGTLQAKAAGVAEITVTANDGSGISAKVTITVADVPMSSMTVDPTSVTLYSSETGSNSDQNLVVVPITYTPNNATFSGTPYTQGSYTYVSTTASVASIQIQAKANVTAEHTETVTLTTKNTVPTTTGSALTATITVTVKPMPKVHFVDIVHGESFSDVVATVNPSDKTEVLFTKTTPTHAADWVSVSSDNTCETNAEHLVGWIWSEWEDVADYLDGSSSSKPGKSALETAGAGVWFTPGASINTQTYEGRTYYAVWAKTVVTP